MIDRSYIGKVIEFTSLKCGHVVAKLLSYNKDHIQVELLQDVNGKIRIWFEGSIRLFDADKISEIEIVDNWKKPEQRRDREVKPRTSKAMTFYVFEKQRLHEKRTPIQ